MNNSPAARRAPGAELRADAAARPPRLQRDTAEPLLAARAEAPPRAPAAEPRHVRFPTRLDVSPAAAMRATMAALLSRGAVRDEVLPGSGMRVSAALAHRGQWDGALLLASGDRSGSHVSRTQARGTLLAVAAEHGAAAPLAALLAALERRALLKLYRARSGGRRNAAARDACGLARTLCTHLLRLLTRPPAVAGVAPPPGERPHCIALVGGTARRLRAAAGGSAAEPPPPLADLPESSDSSESDDDDSDDDGEEGSTASPSPAALADIVPTPEVLFPAPAAAHDAACAAVAASLAEGVPLVWSSSTHSACPPAFRAAIRTAACALRAVGLPSELLEPVVGRAAEAQLWPELHWEAPGVAHFIHTPPPTSLAELERC